MLLSQMQETFCRGVAMGLSAREAARQANYGRRYALAKAAALVRKPAIAQRIEELRGPALPEQIHPDLATLSLPQLRAKVVNESWELILASKAANDRRSALAGLSLISEVTGLKQASLRVENVRSPLNGMSSAVLQRLLAVLDEPSGALGDREVIEGEVVEVEGRPEEHLLG